MIAEGLSKSASKEARSLGEDIAMRWIRTNYATFNETGTMHEKYDVDKCGAFGGGGEYVPQVINKYSQTHTHTHIYIYVDPEEEKCYRQTLNCFC